MQILEQVPDDELIVLLRAGDHDAYTEIYNRYKGLLLIHAYKKLGDFEEAKEVIQDLFLSLWHNREQLPVIKNLAGYLYTLVRNKILNLIEHKQVQSKYASSFKDFIPTDNEVTDLFIREREMKTLIEQEINALPPKMREVFILSRKEHLTYKEIAEKLGISEFTVKNHIKSALRILRTRLSGVLMAALLYYL